MNKHRFTNVLSCEIPVCILALLFAATAGAFAQMHTPTPNDTLHSATIGKDFRIVFRIYAPQAAEVRLGGTDIPEPLRRDRMTKHDNGVWDVTVGPLEPGAYRYNFVVDGVEVLDPRSPSVSESNMNAWSLLRVPGSDVMDTRDVPHGAVSEVTYYSTSLKQFRRMHVYTPPGYEMGTGMYPVFYLLHGAWDCDDSWTSVGMAGSILDNLIAQGTAVPMVVVMPAGHTGPFRFVPGSSFETTDFLHDFENDVRPLVEGHYRVYRDRDHRAIAGLSMGGMQTLDIAISNLGDYAYIGVFSSGIFELGSRQAPAGPTWEDRNRKFLDDAELKRGIRLFWFATGKEDFLAGVSRKTVDVFKQHGFDVVYNESSGGHTWLNWRAYLAQFAPLLFR